MGKNWSLVVLTALLLSTGCLGVGPTQEQSPTATTAATETPTQANPTNTRPASETEPVEITPNESETPTVTETDEPVGTAGFPYEMVVENDENQSVTVDLSVVQNATDESVLDTTVTLGPDAEQEFDISFPATGNYTVRASLDGTTYTTIWTVERVPPSFEIIVTVDDGKIVFVASAA